VRFLPAFAALSCILAIFATPPILRCQENPDAEISGPLANVTVTGSQRFKPDAIIAASGLRKGQTVHREDLQNAADRLIQSGEFADVKYRYQTDRDGVSIEFAVADGTVIPAYFDNFPWFTGEELSQALRLAVPLYDGRVPANGTAVDDVSDALGKMLESHKIGGSVTHRVLRAPDSEHLVQEFQLDGSELPVEAVFFTDPLADEDRAVHQSLSQLIGHPFSRYAIDTFVFEQVRPLYEASAHLRVKIGEPAARFTGDPSQPLRKSVTVIVPIEPGPVYKWAGVTWSGNAAIPAADLNALIGLRDGEPADGVKLRAAWVHVSDEYARLGYLDAEVRPSLEFDDAKSRAAGKVSVVEGPQYHMGDLVLSGLSLDGERRIRAAWRIAPGSVFDGKYFDDFVNGGARTAFGTLPFTYAKVGHFLQKDPKTGKVDVLMDFE
jgi:outer membrane protein assembly factor BamA